MADPWSEDFAALGEKSRAQLRSIDATRNLVSAQPAQESMFMRLFKQRPIVSALLILLALGTVTPLAYALVKTVFITVDTEKSPEELSAEIQRQLREQQIEAVVKVAKPDERSTVLEIWSDDPDLRVPEVNVVPSGDTEVRSEMERIEIDNKCGLTAAEERTLAEAFAKAYYPNHAIPSPQPKAARIVAMRKLLAGLGYEAEVEIGEGVVKIVVKAKLKP